MNIALQAVFAKLPIEHLRTTIHEHILPLTSRLPDKRLRRVAELLILGILGGQTPVITAIARQNSKEAGETWAVAKSLYRWLSNERFTSQELFGQVYAIGQGVVAEEQPEYLVVAVDPVNFEKPYTKFLEGVSVVHKATPPALDGKARLARGYPAITATIVNTQVPVTSYANWFSYQTADFISQNVTTYPAYKVGSYARTKISRSTISVAELR